MTAKLPPLSDGRISWLRYGKVHNLFFDRMRVSGSLKMGDLSSKTSPLITERPDAYNHGAAAAVSPSNCTTRRAAAGHQLAAG